jgi:hypothetical protein
MPLAAAFEDSATISTTEYSMPNDSTTLTPQTDDGVYELNLFVQSIAAGDQFEVKIYEKILNAGTQRLKLPPFIISDVQTSALVVVTGMLLHGWDMTVKKLAGTDRTVEWSIRKVS